MRAWTSTGLATLAMLLAAAHPEWGPLGWGLVGAAGAIAAGQVFTFAVFLRGLVRDGLLISPFGGADADADADADSAATRIPGADVAGLGGGAGEKVVAACLASVAACRQAADVINRSKMLSEIGWLFVGAFSRMGTYAAITASASSLGVVPGAAHKVALEVFWLLSFLTEPVFTACNALLPRELGAGRYQSARKFRGALVAVAAALGAVLASVAAAVTTTGAFSDDPLVTTALRTLTIPVAASLGLSATVYGIEGSIIGAGEVGYLGRTHLRDFFVVLALLKTHETFACFGGGLEGGWWVCATFQGLRIAQHWLHLEAKKPFWSPAERRDGKARKTIGLKTAA